jgi:N-acetylglutamate synthase
MVAPLTLEVIDDVARLHCASLTGLLTRLGVPAARAFYIGCLRTPAAVGFVAVEEGVVRGVVLGSAHPDRLDGEVLRKNPIGTLAALCRGVVRHPSSLGWLLKSRRGQDEGGYDRRVAELKYLAVEAEHRGGGVGRRLVETFAGAMREAGVQVYQLSVDDDNQVAIAFYERLGFRSVGRYREFGAMHRRYEMRIAS